VINNFHSEKIFFTVKNIFYTVDLLILARYRDRTVPDRSASSTVHEVTFVSVHRSRANVRHRSAFSVHRPAFTVHRSASTVHRSSFIVQRPPFSVHRSPFNVFSNLF
jgi:hypothetical protein